MNPHSTTIFPPDADEEELVSPTEAAETEPQAHRTNHALGKQDTQPVEGHDAIHPPAGIEPNQHGHIQG